MDQATRGFAQKQYLDAREAAKAAKRHAIRARDEALGVPEHHQ